MDEDNEIRPVEEKKKNASSVPEVEIHVYRQGKGPVEVLKWRLGGYQLDQLEVRDILEKYAFKAIFAFIPGSGRGVPIRFNRVNGRSLLSYKDGSVLYVDGDPKDSLVLPVTKILVGVVIVTALIAVVLKDPPQWIVKSKLFDGNFPPWILACVVIVFTRMRKRTRDFLKKFGW